MRTTHALMTDRPGNRGNLLVGCGVALVVAIAIVVAVGVWVANSWKGWAAGAITQAVDTSLTEAQIDPAEQTEIMAHVEGLMGRFERGDITPEQFGAVIESLMESPLLPLAAVSVVNNAYIEGSTLPDEDKQDARTQLLRYAVAVSEGDLAPETMDTVVAPLEDPTPDDNSITFTFSVDTSSGQTRERVLKSPSEATEDDLRAVVKEARALADEAGAPESPEPIDLSDEVGAAINSALGEAGAEPLPEQTSSEETTPDQEPDQQPDTEP